MVKLSLRIAAAIAIGVCLAGCSGQYAAKDKGGQPGDEPPLTYRILSFFFEGVPYPYKETGKDMAGAKKPGEKKEKLEYRTHGPFDAKLCDACHIPAEGNKLIMPVEKLCLNCHVLNLKAKKVHGPLFVGGCRICHDPHGSVYRFYLVSDSTKFCFHCHNKKDIDKREVHRDTDKGCTDCHNPHFADNEFLLRK